MANYRLEIRYTQFGMRQMNVLHYQSTGGGTPQSLTAGWGYECLAALRGFLSTSSRINDLRAIDMTTDEEYVASVDMLGLYATDPLPPTCTFLLSFGTKYADRSRKGRMYIPGAPEGLQTNGVITGDGTLLMGALATAMLDVADSGNNYHLAVYSRKNNSFASVETIIPKSYVFTQRRRGYGRGV